MAPPPVSDNRGGGVARVVVIGGGISGLACVHRLLELKKEKNTPGLEILLLEASSRLGGIIQTEKKDGFLLEQGPDAFLSQNSVVPDLCRRLGIEGELIKTQEKNQKSFVVRNGKLLPVPEGYYLIAPTRIAPFLASPLLSWPGKIRAVWERWITSKKNNTDESISSFIRRRFGSESLERIGQAMLAGIYTGDPENLSLKAALPRFTELEASYDSVTRGLKIEARKKNETLKRVQGPRYSLFLSFKDGMQTLSDAIASKLPAGAARLGFGAKSLCYNSQTKAWTIVSDKGESFSAAAVCLAVSPRAASDLASEIDPSLSEKLGRITSESVATIYLAYPNHQISRPLDGFGFVTPAIEKRPLIACSFISNKFSGRSPEGFTLLRAFAGGALGKKIYDLSDMDLMAAARRDVSELLGIRGEPHFSSLKRHPRSMVQYRLGHLDLVSEIRNACDRLDKFFVTGAAYRGVGIPDCIEDALNQAELIFRKVAV